MPSYEPTPKRFSILTVSRSASRRNSISVPSTPIFPPTTPSYSSPADLAAALKHLQHIPEPSSSSGTPDEGRAERGRSREVAGERAALRTTWGHDEPIKVPSPRHRRESSASTRDRIALWEQRSRSQSKGRSKSRGRDLGAGSRISVVPEVPEVLAALAKLGEGGRDGKNEQREEEEKVAAVRETTTPEQGVVVSSENSFRPEKEPSQGTSGFFNLASAENEELMEDPWRMNESPEAALAPTLTTEATQRLSAERRREPAGTADTVSPVSPISDQGTYELSLERRDAEPFEKTSSSGSKTPVRISPQQLPTPSTTPPPSKTVSGTSDSSSSQDTESRGPISPNTPEFTTHTHNLRDIEPIQDVESNENSMLPLAPSTPVRAAISVPAPPLTPEATPSAKPTRSKSPIEPPIQMTFGGELSPRSPHDTLRVAPTTFQPESPAVEPMYRHLKPPTDKDWEDDAGAETFHLPSGLLADVPTEENPKTDTNNNSDDENQNNRAKWPSERSRGEPAPAARSTHTAPANDETQRPADTDLKYHAVWKIQEYEPHFPVPARHIAKVDTETQRLANVDFSGNPLQEPPKSQLSAEAEPFKPLPAEVEAANPYPYVPQGRGGNMGGSYAIDIPPTPGTTYVPPDNRVRQPRQRSRSRPAMRETREAPNTYTTRHMVGKHEWDAPPVIERALHAASVSVIQGLTVPVELYRGLRDSYYPPPGRPDIIKAYPTRRRLPVRIFFPTHHDLTSPALLPTLFTIHGGGFTVGSAADDDAWNRSFADSYTVLVIALNYGKAPWAVFPTPLLDAEALYHAVLNDESLPIDRMRTAICGFDAGGNLALGLAQLPSVKTGYDPARHPNHEREYSAHPYPHQPPRSHPPPAAVISVCGILDFDMPAARKARTRPYKRQLRGPRGWGPGLDWMAKLLPSSAWSYIPYGHDISDPLLSPAYASRADLPPHVFVVAAELDCLAHESWRTACAWAGRAVPDTEILVGRRGPSRWRGCLDDGRGENAAKFAWSETHAGGSGNGSGGGVDGTTRWLLVPDVVHGFDSAGWRTKYLWGDEEARMDAEMKTIAYQREMAEWLWGVVWR